MWYREFIREERPTPIISLSKGLCNFGGPESENELVVSPLSKGITKKYGVQGEVSGNGKAFLTNI